jgi:hypothetical protein
MPDLVDETIAALRSAGYVVLREKSYRQAQERQRVAEALRKAAEVDAERTHAWACEQIDENRRLAARLTYMYGVARAHGLSHDDLASP